MLESVRIVDYHVWQAEDLALAIVWRGSITYNVHTLQEGGTLGPEVDVFSAADSRGQALPIEDAHRAVLDWLSDQLAAQQDCSDQQ